MRAPWGEGRADWQRVLVYGLGLSGRAAARLLLSRGVTVVGVDGRPAAALELGELAADPRLELLAGGEPEALPDGIDGVVLSPGVPPDRPLLADARSKGVPVIAEVELAFPFLQGPVVAITGSNGKSTTTALTGAMLRAAQLRAEVCGNIGEPLAGLVDGEPGRVFVVELSSFQLEGIRTFKPRAAAFLNLAEDHLDRYPDMAAYAAAKMRVFMNQDEEGTAVANADDPATRPGAPRARLRLFSRLSRVEDGCHVQDGRVVEVAPGEAPVELFRLDDVPLAGVQNLENAMAAALLARTLGAEPAELRSALVAFRGLPHRMEKVRVRGGVTFYDDSKGTNPAATAKSLEGFADGTVHLILGGRNKGAELGALAPLVARKARRVYLIGEAADDLEFALAGSAPIERSDTLDRAVAAAAERAAPGEVVVLSPACASFDQFKNFAHRGQVFQGLVRELPGGSGGPDG